MLNNTQKNLQNIKRIDSDATDILLYCTQAALYEYSLTENKWANKDQMGPLFVYKRSTFPFYSIMIANRQSLDDYVQPIIENLNLKYDPPYILIHREDGSIGGLWIYGEDECKRIFTGIQQLRDAALSPLKAQVPSEKTTEKTTALVQAAPALAQKTQVSVQNSSISSIQKPQVLAQKTAAAAVVVQKETPVPVQKAPVPTQNTLAASLQKISLTTKKAPVASQKTSISMQKAPVSIQNSRLSEHKNNAELKAEETPSTANVVQVVVDEKNASSASALKTPASSTKTALENSPKADAVAAAAATVLPEMNRDDEICSDDVWVLKQILLDMIKRIDPFACELVAYSPRAVLYEYSTIEKRWHRTDTEGPLIVIARIDEPLFSLLVADRRKFGKDDFVQPLVVGLKLTNKPPYIFLSGRSDNSVYGIWLQETVNCERVYRVLAALMKKLIVRREAQLQTIEMS